MYVGIATVSGAAWWFMYFEDGPQVTYYQMVHCNTMHSYIPLKRHNTIMTSNNSIKITVLTEKKKWGKGLNVRTFICLLRFEATFRNFAPMPTLMCIYAI